MMELTKQKGEYRNSSTETFASLALGLFATSLIVSNLWQVVLITIVGVVCALSGIYLKLQFKWKQEWFLRELGKKQTMRMIKSFGWFLVLAVFGTNLTQLGIGWLKVLGILFALIAYFVLLFAFWTTSKKRELIKKAKDVSLKEVQAMGSKGRRNVKKPKKAQEKGQEKKPEEKK